MCRLAARWRSGEMTHPARCDLEDVTSCQMWMQTSGKLVWMQTLHIRSRAGCMATVVFVSGQLCCKQVIEFQQINPSAASAGHPQVKNDQIDG